MKIKIVVTANETGYAYNQPEGKAVIEIDIDEGSAESIEIGVTAQAATIGAIRKYRAEKLNQIMAKTLEGSIEA